jgi:hypothetical protein
MEVPQRQLFINGGWAAPARGQYLDVINPATERPFARIPNATQEDVEAAVAAACAAAKRGVWTKTSGAHRATFLRAIAAKVRPMRRVATAPLRRERPTVERCSRRSGSASPSLPSWRRWTAASPSTRRSGTW